MMMMMCQRVVLLILTTLAQNYDCVTVRASSMFT